MVTLRPKALSPQSISAPAPLAGGGGDDDGPGKEAPFKRATYGGIIGMSWMVRALPGCTDVFPSRSSA